MKIIQQTNKTATQIMGYTVVAKSGHVLVIDGGCHGNGAELTRIIKSVGGHVDLWLITHPHSDHHDAIMDVLSSPQGITYEKLGASQLTDEWAKSTNWPDSVELLQWNEFARHNLDQRYFNIEKDQVFQLGSMKVEVLAVCNPEILTNPINNQSAVFRITEDGFTFLVLGDLGVEAGQKLLDSGRSVKADAVQMAHHGQGGVNEAFYQAVSPTYCFWPTPDWLWNNILHPGDTPGSGPFKTQQVASWMKKLNTVNIFSMKSTVMFDSDTGQVTPY